jgi:hypothetical protein
LVAKTDPVPGGPKGLKELHATPPEPTYVSTIGINPRDADATRDASLRASRNDPGNPYTAQLTAERVATNMDLRFINSMQPT